MEKHINFIVQDRFFAPAENALSASGNTRKCTAVSDINHLHSGVGRVMMNVVSGRDWVQQSEAVVGKSVKVSQFFEAQNSSRRLGLLEDVNDDLVKQCDRIDEDPFAEHSELDNFSIHAGDGHYNACSTHEEEIEGKRRPVGYFYFANLRTQALRHLDIAKPDIIKKMKKEHDMSVLKRVEGEALRFGTPKGKQVIIAYDRAVIDFTQWQRWKRTKGVYIITRGKSNMKLLPISYPDFDRSDSRNAGVVADQSMQTSNGVMVRRVTYIDPVDGIEYHFLTNEFNIPPGLVAYIYKRRWDIEKVFDEKKNKCNEKKAWGKSDIAKCQQALFICIAHNLNLLFEHLLKTEEGIEDKIADRRREERKKTEITIAEKAGRAMAPMLKKLYKRVQRSFQFIRWLRLEFLRRASWSEAVSRLRPCMEKYLL